MSEHKLFFFRYGFNCVNLTLDIYNAKGKFGLISYLVYIIINIILRNLCPHLEYNSTINCS